MNLNVAIDSEVINIDGTVTKFLGKDAFKYKVKNIGNVHSFFLVLSQESWKVFYFL